MESGNDTITATVYRPPIESISNSAIWHLNEPWKASKSRKMKEIPNMWYAE